MKKFLRMFKPEIIAITAWIAIVVGSYLCGVFLSKANTDTHEDHMFDLDTVTFIERMPLR